MFNSYRAESSYMIVDNFSMGFDINVFDDALNKSVRGEELSNLEIHALNKAKSFLEVIAQFCNGQHCLYFTGISGAEAFSIYVRATKNTGTLDDVIHSISPKIEILQGLEDQKTIQDTNIPSLIEVFKSIFRYISGNLSQSFMGTTTGWRI